MQVNSFLSGLIVRQHFDDITKVDFAAATLTQTKPWVRRREKHRYLKKKVSVTFYVRFLCILFIFLSTRCIDTSYLIV
jgi:hypothetical protein